MNRRMTVRALPLLLATACAGCGTASPAPGLGEPGTMGDSVVRGSALLQNGQPAARADVYVAVAEGIAGDPGACERPGAVLALTRTAPDGNGRWLARIPRVEPGAGTPACLLIAAEVRDTAGPLRDRVTARTWTGVPIGGGPVHLVLERVEPAPPGRDPIARRPEGAWIDAAGRIPGWGGFIFGEGGCTVIVSLADPRQQEAARAYVDSVLRAERGGPPPGCGGRRYEFRRVQYDWAQLQRWYGRIGILGGFRGMQSSDVDEARNRIVLRFTDPAGARAARRALPLLRVPPEAVAVEAPEQPAVVPSDTFGPDTPLLGTRLAARWWPGSPAWSADGREILFVTAEEPQVTRLTVRAVDAGSRAVRELVGIQGMNTGGSHLRQAADGSVYAAIPLPGSTASALWHIPPGGGPAGEVARGLAWPWFAVDAAGRRFAFPWTAPGEPRTHQELVVMDRETERRDAVRGEWMALALRPLELSPDGGTLVYRVEVAERPEDAGVWMYDVRTRETRQLWRQPQDHSEAAAAVRWHHGAPRLLVARRTGATEAELAELDPAAARRVPLGAVPIAPGEGAPGTAAWTADGRRVAYWAPVALGPQACGGGNCISRRVVHWRLYAWEPGRSDPRPLADVAADEDAAWLAFSPDGRRIAYVLHGSLYVHDLP